MRLPNLQDEHAHKLITVTPRLTPLTVNEPLAGLADSLRLGFLAELALNPITVPGLEGFGLAYRR